MRRIIQFTASREPGIDRWIKRERGWVVKEEEEEG